MIALYLASCYYTCPGDRAPIDLGVDWSIQYRIPPVYVGRTIGMLEAPADGAWVCSIECDVDWAGAWVGSEKIPFTPLELPDYMPPSDPITGSEVYSSVGFWLDGSAPVGAVATCDFSVSGPEIWSLTVEVLP